jgi:methylated-DNA-[protein]-cysteine S-methyltransferase
LMTSAGWISLETPLGPFVILGTATGLIASSFEPDIDAFLDRMEAALGGRLAVADRQLAKPRSEIEGYFAGRKSRFASRIDLALVGGTFARRVLGAARRIPYGAMATYGDVAAMAGSPRASRAAGTALRNCPFELFVPCHRVVPAGPGFGTYGGHPERREFLLRLEGAI